MTRKELFNHINDINMADNRIYAYYVTYKVTENITTQDWGKYSYQKFNYLLDKIEESDLCVQGLLPIERLILYCEGVVNGQYQLCFAFCKNPLWDCVNMDSEDSHTLVTVPYICKEGGFGAVVSEKVLYNKDKESEV